MVCILRLKNIYYEPLHCSTFHFHWLSQTFYHKGVHCLYHSQRFLQVYQGNFNGENLLYVLGDNVCLLHSDQIQLILLWISVLWTTCHLSFPNISNNMMLRSIAKNTTSVTSWYNTFSFQTSRSLIKFIFTLYTWMSITDCIHSSLICLISSSAGFLQSRIMHISDAIFIQTSQRMYLYKRICICKTTFSQINFLSFLCLWSCLVFP